MASGSTRITVRSDGAETTWDGKVKNQVYDADLMEWVPSTGGSASPGSEVEVTNFPANPSTSTLQTTANTKLDSVNTKLDSLLTELQLKADLLETQPVSVSGGATAARQDTGNTSLALLALETGGNLAGIKSDTAAIKTAVEIIDNAIAGNEMQVDVLTLPNITIGAAIPAGTNNIGDVDVLSLPSLVAGSANIGDVDVLTLPALVAGTALIGKVGIDQTTPGTTNKVSIGNDGTVVLGAGTAGIGKLTANAGVTIGAVEIAAAQTLATVTTVGTVTAVTGITNALPAGTNRLGSFRPVDSADADLTAVVGTQASRAIAVQPQSEAGRTQIRFYFNAVASGTTGTETAITMTKSSGTSATTTAATFAITNGKRFRITSITFGVRGHLTGTVQITNFRIRVNTAGAVTTGSTPIILDVACATPATSLAWDRWMDQSGDVDEILGTASLQFGVTAAAVFTTNAPTWFGCIKGFEY